MTKLAVWFDRNIRNIAFAELFQFQIKDAIKAARIEATETYKQYGEELKTSQRRWGFDPELVLQQYGITDANYDFY